MPVAHLTRNPPRPEVSRRLIDERAEQAGEQVDLDVAAEPGALALGERGEDADRRVLAGEDVDEGHPDLGRLAPGAPVMLMSPPTAWTTKS
ncbi:hypothetical protein GCM10025883_31490 [Mobilicoccus caccae]|uniref:Uncharacterized protein n=1 Tax=Mobilicoccus caccae TaxID=1859295 RepID=A0ABQ6IUE9_9MICO|nr:hypothetical protein GCM10025883_31490 [Mobilicoccus caccae]